MYIANRRRRVAILALPLLLVLTAGCDIAFSDFRATESAEWRKTYELMPGGRVEIGNVNGKIEVQTSTGNSVEVIARKTARASTSEAAKQALERTEIQDSASPSSIRIETKAPRGTSLFGGSNVEVQYAVRVPAGADVKFTTVNGGVEVTGLTGQVTAETVNGGVKLIGVSGGVNATTVNGGVDVELTRVSDSGVRLGCTNGGIKLLLPRDAKANLSARIMNGGINTTGLDIETSGESSRRRLEGRLNGGGPRIDVEGTNGGIRISARQ